MRRTLLLLAMVAMALMVAMPIVYAKVVNGTAGDDPNLRGTKFNDKITCRGGDDITNGLKGNDAYNYADGWGQDVVVDSGGAMPSTSPRLRKGRRSTCVPRLRSRTKTRATPRTHWATAWTTPPG